MSFASYISWIAGMSALVLAALSHGHRFVNPLDENDRQFEDALPDRDLIELSSTPPVGPAAAAVSDFDPSWRGNTLGSSGFSAGRKPPHTAERSHLDVTTGFSSDTARWRSKGRGVRVSSGSVARSAQV